MALLNEIGILANLPYLHRAELMLRDAVMTNTQELLILNV